MKIRTRPEEIQAVQVLVSMIEQGLIELPTEEEFNKLVTQIVNIGLYAPPHMLL